MFKVEEKSLILIRCGRLNLVLKMIIYLKKIYLNWSYDEFKQSISNLQYYFRISQRQMYSNSYIKRDISPSIEVQSLGINNKINIYTNIFSYWKILYKISIFLSVNVKFINRLRKTGNIERAFEVRTTNYISNYIIVSYFLKYPLYSYKYNNIEIFKFLIQIYKSRQTKK